MKRNTDTRIAPRVTAWREDDVLALITKMGGV